MIVRSNRFGGTAFVELEISMDQTTIDNIELAYTTTLKRHLDLATTKAEFAVVLQVLAMIATGPFTDDEIGVFVKCTLDDYRAVEQTK